MSGAYWDYSEPFIYDGSPKTVKVAGLPDGVSAEYFNASATDADDSSATDADDSSAADAGTTDEGGDE